MARKKSNKDDSQDMLVAQLLDSVSKKKSVRPFLQLTAEKRLAARAALSPMQSRRFFESVQALLEHVVEKLAYKGPNAGATQSFLSAIATLLQQEEKPGEAAYQVALSLSQLLYEVDDKTQKAILDLVSTWWIQEARHRETLVPRALLLWTEQAVQAALIGPKNPVGSCNNGSSNSWLVSDYPPDANLWPICCNPMAT